MKSIAVIDFETTGISPEAGARATEVAVVMLEGGRIVDRFQSLMNAGAWVPPFIESLTGISNAMVQAAAPAYAVMREAARFVGDAPLAAHNAAFDRRFWQAELARADCAAAHPFVCTMLLSRRLCADAPSHRLGALAQWFDLPQSGRAHRALADAEVTAHLLARMQRELCKRHDFDEADHALLGAVQALSRRGLARGLQALWQQRYGEPVATRATM